MKLKYSIHNGNIYDQHGNEITPDAKGYVHLHIAGKDCRFVKELFIAWVLRNPHVKTLQVKNKTVKHRKPQKPRAKETRPRIRHGLKIKAVKDGVELGPFISLSDAAKNIGIAKSTISKVMAGRIVKTQWEFKKVV